MVRVDPAPEGHQAGQVLASHDGPDVGQRFGYAGGEREVGSGRGALPGEWEVLAEDLLTGPVLGADVDLLDGVNDFLTTAILFGHDVAADHPALFLTDYGEPASPEFIAVRVRKCMEWAGIDRPGATHLLRHACATHMLEGGADVRFLQAMLGHENLETTAIYTHVAIDKLQAIHEACHPAKMHRSPPVDDSGA